MGNNINLNGLDNINNENYQKLLTQKSEEILAGNESISVNELKNKPLFQDAFKNLNDEQKATLFDKMAQIANFDNNAEINKEELNTILTLMDASFNNSQKAFELDGNFEIGENCAILKDEVKIEKMSRKDAKMWVKDYMEQTGCSKKEAYKAFEQTFGYEVPKNIWEKIGDGLKTGFAFIASIGLLIVVGTDKMNNGVSK